MNLKSLLTVTTLSFSLLITGCSLFSTEGESEGGSSSTASTGNAGYDTMLADVTAKFKAVAKEGGAWSSAEEHIEKAAEAAKEKDFDKAMKLLKKADAETALAKAQFEAEKNAGPHLF